jgi:hypothetical protein
MKAATEKLLPVDMEAIRDISLAVYTARLGDKEAASLRAKRDEEHGDGDAYIRRCAGSLDTFTRVYLQVLGVPLPRMTRMTRS